MAADTGELPGKLVVWLSAELIDVARLLLRKNFRARATGLSPKTARATGEIQRTDLPGVDWH